MARLHGCGAKAVQQKMPAVLAGILRGNFQSVDQAAGFLRPVFVLSIVLSFTSTDPCFSTRTSSCLTVSLTC
jgi:hypothetical protein